MPVDVPIKLRWPVQRHSVTVEGGGDLIENDPIRIPTWTRTCSIELPLESHSSSLSSLVTLATAWRRGRLQRSVSRLRRPRGKFLFG